MRKENDFGTLEGASSIRAIALTVRFLLELALLTGVAVLAWHVATGWWRWPAAILAVLVVATVWGLFLSPKAAISSPAVVRLVVEAALFIGTGVGLGLLGFGIVAGIGVSLWIIHRIVLAIVKT